ncbi:MAG TPA: hypothetical protein PKH31_14485 [Candidatus Sumerlaeota bacterium]|nr:hypothetical protein [Candidatus Sumerlaeota bacterium]
MDHTSSLLLGFAAVASVICVMNCLIAIPINRKLKALFEQTSPLADVRSKCMIRESSLEEPGSAQVLEGDLWISTVTGKNLCVPLSQIKLTKVSHNKWYTRYLGRSGWWRKTRFHLETPKTCGLILGVNDPEQWERVLKQSVS